MSDEIKITYRGVAITYSEYNSKFKSEDFRDKGSLTEMKAAIDRSLDAQPKGEKAQPVSAFEIDSQGMRPVTITSRTEDGGAWIKRECGKRQKIREYSFYTLRPRTAASQLLYQEWKELETQRKEIVDKQSKIEARMPMFPKNISLDL